jgi:hypothetical protein
MFSWHGTYVCVEDPARPQTSAHRTLQNWLASVPAQFSLLRDLKPDATFTMQGSREEHTSNLISMRQFMSVFQWNMPGQQTGARAQSKPNTAAETIYFSHKLSNSKADAC